MGPPKELRNHVKLEFGVLASLLVFLCGVHAGLQIKKTPSTIKTLLGETLTIPCVLTRDDNQQLDLDLLIVGIRWKKISENGSEIDVYKFLNLKHEQVRPESFIDEEELRKGDASLTLCHVQTSDEGEYTCTIFVTPYKLVAKFHVQLLAQPDVTLFTTEPGSEKSSNDLTNEPGSEKSGNDSTNEPGSEKSGNDFTIELGSEKSVTCKVSKFYPKMVKIQWVRYNKGSGTISSLDEVTFFTVTKENSDGSFNVSSLVTVKPSSLGETGDSYSCTVTHKSFNSDKKVTFTLIVKDKPTNHLVTTVIVIVILVLISAAAVYYIFLRKIPPKILHVGGIDDLVHDKNSNLTWMVSDFKPKNIEINVYLDRGDGKRENIPWKTAQAPNNDMVDNSGRTEEHRLLQQPHAIQFLIPKSSFFSYSRLCTLNITPDKRNDEEAELVIKVKHAALKTVLTKRQKLNIKGDIFTARIIGPQCFRLGEEVTLTCEFTKCDPGRLPITWLKGKQVIFMDGNVQDARYLASETLDVRHERNVLKSSSSLTFKVQFNEDHGMKYTCRVRYPALDQILVRHLEIFIIAQPVVEQITSKDVGEQMELSCRIHSFYPETIEIKWFKENKVLPTTDCELRTGEGGLYSTTAILMYIPNIEDIGKTFRCKVDHQSLPNPETRKWKLEERGRNGIKSESVKQ